MTCDELRAFVLGLPGHDRACSLRAPDFRAGGKIIGNLDEDERTLTIKLSIEEQSALVSAAPVTHSLPGGWARSGWTTISLDQAHSDEVRELITEVWSSAKTPRR
jgi:hypothetical protein